MPILSAYFFTWLDQLRHEFLHAPKEPPAAFLAAGFSLQSIRTLCRESLPASYPQTLNVLEVVFYLTAFS